MLSEELTRERLRELLGYDPESGIFVWRAHRRNGRNGTKAGRVTRKGYVRITVDGKSYAAHRLAWLYTNGVLPDMQIDHINGVRADNRLQNLRLATQTQQNMNRAPNKNKTTKGITWHARRNRWQAQIMLGGKNHYLGLYSSPEMAREAYDAAAKKMFGEFRRSRP